MHSLQFEHKSILSSESGNLHNFESRPKWMGQLGLNRLCPLWKRCNVLLFKTHQKNWNGESLNNIMSLLKGHCLTEGSANASDKVRNYCQSAVAHLGNKLYSIDYFKSCRWFYVTWWYLCWQTMLHWSTWVTIQSLQTLRHNGYLSLGQPNPA